MNSSHPSARVCISDTGFFVPKDSVDALLLQSGYPAQITV